jgi:hypothetical protein
VQGTFGAIFRARDLGGSHVHRLSTWVTGPPGYWGPHDTGQALKEAKYPDRKAKSVWSTSAQALPSVVRWARWVRPAW